jgi:hypothetical protein
MHGKHEADFVFHAYFIKLNARVLTSECKRKTSNKKESNPEHAHRDSEQNLQSDEQGAS